MASPAIKSCMSIDPKEEYLVDLDASIQENKLTLGSLDQIKQVIMNNSDIISNNFCLLYPNLLWSLPFPTQSLFTGLCIIMFHLPNKLYVLMVVGL